LETLPRPKIEMKASPMLNRPGHYRHGRKHKSTVRVCIQLEGVPVKKKRKKLSKQNCQKGGFFFAKLVRGCGNVFSQEQEVGVRRDWVLDDI